MTLDFEYLEPKDGVIVQIIHDSEKNDIELQGKIKGKLPIRNINQMPKLFKKINFSRKKRRPYEKIRIMIMSVLMIVEVIMFDLVEFRRMSRESYERINFIDNTIGSSVVLILLNIIIVLFSNKCIKKFFRKIILNKSIYNFHVNCNKYWWILKVMLRFHEKHID